MNFIKYLFSYAKNMDELQAYEKALAEANKVIERAKVIIDEKDQEIEEIYNVNDGLHKEIDELNTKIKEQNETIDKMLAKGKEIMDINKELKEKLDAKLERQKDMEEEIKKMEQIRKSFDNMLNYNHKKAIGK